MQETLKKQQRSHVDEYADWSWSGYQHQETMAAMSQDFERWLTDAREFNGDPTKFFSERVYAFLGTHPVGVRLMLLTCAGRYLQVQPRHTDAYFKHFPEDREAAVALMNKTDFRTFRIGMSPTGHDVYDFNSSDILLYALLPDTDRKKIKSRIPQEVKEFVTRRTAAQSCVPSFAGRMLDAKIYQKAMNAFEVEIRTAYEHSSFDGLEDVREIDHVFDNKSFLKLSKAQREHAVRYSLMRLQYDMLVGEVYQGAASDRMYSILEKRARGSYALPSATYQSILALGMGDIRKAMPVHQLVFEALRFFSRSEMGELGHDFVDRKKNVDQIIEFWVQNRNPLFTEDVVQALLAQDGVYAVNTLLSVLRTDEHPESIAALLFRIDAFHSPEKLERVFQELDIFERSYGNIAKFFTESFSIPFDGSDIQRILRARRDKIKKVLISMTADGMHTDFTHFAREVHRLFSSTQLFASVCADLKRKGILDMAVIKSGLTEAVPCGPSMANSPVENAAVALVAEQYEPSSSVHDAKRSLYYPRTMREDLYEGLRQKMRRPTTRAYMFRTIIDGRLSNALGSLCVFSKEEGYDPESYYMSSVMLQGELRGTGLGKALLDRAVRDVGSDASIHAVCDFNPALLELYTSLGFAVHGITFENQTYEDSDQQIENVLLTRPKNAHEVDKQFSEIRVVPFPSRAEDVMSYFSGENAHKWEITRCAKNKQGVYELTFAQ